MSEYWKSTGPAGFGSHTERQPTLLLLVQNDGGYAITFGCSKVIIDGHIRTEIYYSPQKVLELLKGGKKMNREWFKNRANQKFKESIDLLNKVKDNIQYIRDVKEAYDYELDTEIFKGTFFILDEIDININKSLELVKTNSIEGGTHKAVAQKIVIDGINVYCPECNELIADTYQNGVIYVHKCPYCNQKLDWEIEVILNE